MRDLVLLFVHVVTVLIRLVRPGGMRAVLAESVLLRHQLLILNRSRHRVAESLHLGPGYRRIVRDTCAAETIGTIRISTFIALWFIENTGFCFPQNAE
jgi:hypothetical protein